MFVREKNDRGIWTVRGSDLAGGNAVNCTGGASGDRAIANYTVSGVRREACSALLTIRSVLALWTDGFHSQVDYIIARCALVW